MLKKSLLLSIMFLLIFSLWGCLKANDSAIKPGKKDDLEINVRDETIADITHLLYEKFELHLKPQAEALYDDFFNLNGIKPRMYELVDDMILIYSFKDKEDLTTAEEQIPKNAITYAYTIKENILILYYPNESSSQTTINKTNKALIEAIEYIEKNL